ncbi:MAG TPA: hypothetical protein VID05_00185 [Acidimicrobiales bacterium]|jgi:hypothetical protein
MDESTNDGEQAGFDRRAMLRRIQIGAVATGAAWVAPSVLDAKSAFAATSPITGPE